MLLRTVSAKFSTRGVQQPAAPRRCSNPPDLRGLGKPLQCFQIKRKCALTQHPERQALTNKFGPFDGGLRRSSGRCHFSPVGRSLLKAPLGKQKTGDQPRKHPVGSRYERMKKYRRATLTIGDARRSVFSVFATRQVLTRLTIYDGKNCIYGYTENQ